MDKVHKTITTQQGVGIYVAWAATATGITARPREAGNQTKTNSTNQLAASNSLYSLSSHIEVHYIIPYSSLGVTGAAQNHMTSDCSPLRHTKAI
jgi:hypothetical protein